MQRVPSRRPTAPGQASSVRGGLMLVVYEPVLPHEAEAVERNVRACMPDVCMHVEWRHWKYDAPTQRLTASAEVVTDDVDMVTTVLYYRAWDVMDHFSKVLVSFDALVWPDWFHRANEDDYQEYLEEERWHAEAEAERDGDRS